MNPSAVLLIAMVSWFVLVAGTAAAALTVLARLVTADDLGATGEWLAEAMEARGFGRSGATRAPRPPWATLDYLALCCAVLLVGVAALWL